MPTTTTTHLNFRGEARQALEFYRSVSGGQLTIVTYGDLDAAQEPAQADQVMWGQVLAPGGFHVMAYDVQPATDRAQSQVAVRVESARAGATRPACVIATARPGTPGASRRGWRAPGCVRA